MTKCVKCAKRKGKRHCPALERSICSLCCGQQREKKIHCPPSCSFLLQHKPYQDQRFLEKRHPESSKRFSPETDLLNDERLAWLAFNIEMPIAQLARKESALLDRDALLALAYAREKVEKEKSLIIVPDARLQPKNDLGEAILQNLQQCRFTKNIILPGTIQTYKKEEKIRCLDRIILTIKQITGSNIQGKAYLKKLNERFIKLDELSRQSKIFTPSS